MELVRRRNRISVILIAILTVLAVGVVMLFPAQAAAASKPGQVKNVKVSSKCYNSVKLTWSKAKGTTGYRVYRATSKNGRYKKIKTTKSRSYTNSKLTTGKRYYYKVRAYKGKRYGKFSSKKSGIPKVGTPSLKAASAGTTSIKLSWTKVAGASGYKLYRGNTCIKTTKATSYTNSSLKQGTKYSYKVRAYRTVKKKNYYGNYSSSKSIATKVGNASVSLSYGGKTLKLGAAFDSKLLGSADMVVNRGIRKVYVYDSKDYSNYLEVNVGTTGKWSGKVLGWYTNQKQIGVVNGKDIKQGMSNSQVRSILNSTTKSSSDYAGAKDFAMNHESKLKISDESIGGTMFCGIRTASADIRAGEIRLNYVEQRYSPNLVLEDKVMEHRINSLRYVNGYNLLAYNEKLYDAGIYPSSDYAKHETIRPLGKEHVTSDGRTMEERFNALGLINGAECAYGIRSHEVAIQNGLASALVTGYYNSNGHRSVMIIGDFKYFANCTAAGPHEFYGSVTNYISHIE